MKTTLLLYSAIILFIGSTDVHAQPARPKTRSQVMLSQNVTTNAAITTATTNADGSVTRTDKTTTTTTPPSLIPSNSTPIMVNSHISLNSGVILLNPYSLTTNGLAGDTTKRRALDKGNGTQAKFFIDLAVNYVWAWDSDRRARFAKEFNDNGEDHWFWHGTMPVDIQTHISYYAKDSSETTASAIVGSGNFGGEVTLGIPLYRAIYTTSGNLPSSTNKQATTADSEDLYNQTESVHWLGLVGSYSGATDSDSFSVHNRYLLGLGYRAAFPSLNESKDGTKPREFVLSVTVAAAGVDTVQFLRACT